MPLVAEVGDAVQASGEMTFEWKLCNFFSLSDKKDDFYNSPVFSFAESRWCLRLYPNGNSTESDGWVDLFLERIDTGPPKTMYYTLGIRSSDGVEKKKEFKDKFEKNAWGFSKFKSRSELRDQKAAYLPNDVLTVTCDLRSDGAVSVVTANDLLKKEVESLMEQIKTHQKTVENYDLESQNYKKQISTLEREKLSIVEEYKGLLEEKLTVVSGLERGNCLLEKVVESLMEQIKTHQKTVENYELESQNYKKQISTLESEKLSIVEEYKCLLEEKLTIVSGLEKGNGLLEKEMENYKLESENYKKQISALKSSGLRKVIFFGTLLFIALEFLSYYLLD